jgi:hypothetical protein
MNQTEIWYGEIQPQETNKVEGKKQHQVKIPNRFAALEILNDDVGTNRAWETVRGREINESKTGMLTGFWWESQN